MCYKLNGYLAIISSQIEMDTINENLSIQKMPYWIGPSKNYSAWCDGNTKVNQRCVYLKPVLGGIYLNIYFVLIHVCQTQKTCNLCNTTLDYFGPKHCEIQKFKNSQFVF